MLYLPAKHDEGGAGAEQAAEPDESRLSYSELLLLLFFLTINKATKKTLVGLKTDPAIEVHEQAVV